MAAREASGEMSHSPLRAIDARARILAFALSLIVAASAVGSSAATLAALCASPILLTVVARVPLRIILGRLSLVAGFVVIAGVCTFLVPIASHPSPARFWFLLFGSLFAVTSAAVLAYSTSATEAMEALQSLRVPHHMIWIGFLGLRYLPLVYGEGRRTHRAAVARGWGQALTRDKHGLVTAQGLVPLAWMSTSLVSRGFNRAVRTGEAMEARGFGSGMVTIQPRPLRLCDWAVIAGYPGTLLVVRLLLDGVLA